MSEPREGNKGDLGDVLDAADVVAECAAAMMRAFGRDLGELAEVKRLSIALYCYNDRRAAFDSKVNEPDG